jgi:hypothetical protein
MAANTFRRDQQPGVTQAEFERAIRAVRAEDPGATIEFDPKTQRLAIKVSTSASAAAATAAPGETGNPWDEVLTDAANKERPS